MTCHSFPVSSPKIKIENGSPKCFETAAPKVIKKETKKNVEDKHTLDVKKEMKKSPEDKNTLDVAVTEHRRHKKSRESTSKGVTKTKHKTKSVEEVPKKEKEREKEHKHKRTANKLVKQSSVKDSEGETKAEIKEKVKDGAHGVMNFGQPKPPNVLVYADSIITKDNVKRVLFSILNKEK